jgi:hypothetical protein
VGQLTIEEEDVSVFFNIQDTESTEKSAELMSMSRATFGFLDSQKDASTSFLFHSSL